MNEQKFLFHSEKPIPFPIPEDTLTSPSELLHPLSSQIIKPVEVRLEEIDPAKLSKADLSDLLDEIVYGHGKSDKWKNIIEEFSDDILKQNKITLIVMEFWKRTDVDFAEKCSLLRGLQTAVENRALYDGSFTDLVNGLMEAIKNVASSEENFFLSAVAESFLNEKPPQLSLTEIREDIRTRWEHYSIYRNDTGGTSFEGVDITAKQDIHSVDDISDEDILKIGAKLSFQDEYLFSPEKLQNFSLRRKFTEKKLQEKVITTYQSEWLQEQVLEKNGYEFTQGFDEITLSSISTEFGAVYKDLSVQEIFTKETIKESGDITPADIRLLVDIFIDFYGTNTKESLSTLIDRLVPLLQKDSSILAIIYSAEQNFKNFPKTSQKKIQGENDYITDEILWEILSFLQKKITSSTTRSLSVNDVIIEQLGNSINKQEAQELAQIYESFISLRMRNFFENFFDFSLTDVPFRIQLQFINYVHNKSKTEIQVVQNFIKKAGTSLSKAHRFNVFLALENKISPEIFYKIDQVIPSPIADKVFAKYTEIVSIKNSVEEILTHEKGLKETITKKSIEDISKKILQRGCELLIEISETKDFNESALLETLEGLKVNIELFKATFKTLKEQGYNIALDDLKDNTMMNQRGSELSEYEINQMRTLYIDSMSGYPDATKDELIKKFNLHTVEAGSRFTILRHNDEIIGFLCFTETKPGQKYVSAVTLDPRFQKSYIGEAMLKQTFDREAQENVLGADCIAQKSVSARYIENGFIGVKSWDDQGELILDIIRDDASNAKFFPSKSLTQAEIITLAPLGKLGNAKVETADDPKNYPFTFCNNGFVLTRYFRDDTKKKWYFVYEPRPTKESLTREKANAESTSV